MIDTREKRAAIPGVGRPWMRGKLPGANDEQRRAASANSYGGNPLTPSLALGNHWVFDAGQFVAPGASIGQIVAPGADRTGSQIVAPGAETGQIIGRES